MCVFFFGFIYQNKDNTVINKFVMWFLFIGEFTGALLCIHACQKKKKIVNAVFFFPLCEATF